GGRRGGRGMSILSSLTLGHYLALSAVLFCISVAGIFLNRKNVIMLLMSLELLLLSVNVNFVAFSRSLGDAAGQVFVFFILTVAAAEAACGLAILVTRFRNRRTLDVADIDSVKGWADGGGNPDFQDPTRAGRARAAGRQRPGRAV